MARAEFITESPQNAQIAQELEELVIGANPRFTPPTPGNALTRARFKEDFHAYNQRVQYSSSDGPNPRMIIVVAAAYSDFIRTDPFSMFGHLPDEMAVPAFALWLSPRDDVKIKVATPYGVQPNRVYGENGNAFFFRKLYLVGTNGQGVGYDEVGFEPSHSGDTTRIPRLDFTPECSASRHVRLTEGSYRNISLILQRAKGWRGSY